MESIYLLIPIALVFVALGVWLFFWAVDNGQFDDLEGPAHSILFDEDGPRTDSSAPPSEQVPEKNQSLSKLTDTAQHNEDKANDA